MQHWTASLNKEDDAIIFSTFSRRQDANASPAIGGREEYEIAASKASVDCVFLTVAVVVSNGELLVEEEEGGGGSVEEDWGKRRDTGPLSSLSSNRE
jgi:hypothetical protein